MLGRITWARVLNWKRVPGLTVRTHWNTRRTRIQAFITWSVLIHWFCCTSPSGDSTTLCLPVLCPFSASDVSISASFCTDVCLSGQSPCVWSLQRLVRRITHGLQLKAEGRHPSWIYFILGWGTTVE